MDLTTAARKINDTGYGYISSWALLTACEQRLFDRLPATAEELTDTYPDPSLVETWLHVLAEEELVELVDGVWQLHPSMERLLAGDNSYADYLGGQVLQQMTPRLTLGRTGENVLADVLSEPHRRAGYEGWFADSEEAHAYQASQYAGSLGPAKAIATSLPDPDDRVLDLGGGWGAIARSIAKHHDVDVDVVDLEVVVEGAPPVGDRVSFVAGSALDPATWPTDTDGVSYDGAVLSYLFSSIPGENHEPLLDALSERDVRWIAIHDFMVGNGAHAAAWSLQHAVFVPGHQSRSADDLSAMLVERGFDVAPAAAVVDEMTTLVVGSRDN
ncbi:MAG: methyltransferase [Actinomycetota bacterium]